MTDDIDTPVDEALLMGEEPDDELPDEPTPQDDPADDEPAPDEEAKKESDQIPKWRFNEINDERKALKAELEALKAQRTEPPKQEPREASPDVRSLRDRESDIEAQIEESMMEGDIDQRKVLRAELRKVRDQIDAATRAEVDAQAETKLSQRAEIAAVQQVAERLEADYTIFRAEGGNQAAIDMTVELRDAYIARGASPSQALKAAADRVLALFGDTAKADPQTADPRKAAAIKKGVETNNATPPKGGGVGNRAQAPREDVANISQSKWEKLSASERERLLSA